MFFYTNLEITVQKILYKLVKIEAKELPALYDSQNEMG